MLRTVAFSRTTTALVAIAWLALASSIALTSATFADDGTTASPSSADSGGGSEGGAASTTSGNDGGGNDTAAVSSTTNTNASVDDTTATAETTTQAAAATSQSSGSVAPPKTPHPGPSVNKVLRGKHGNWKNGGWKNNWKKPDNAKQFTKPKNTDGNYQRRKKNEEKKKTPELTTQTVPQGSGPGQGTAAGVSTKVHVKAHNEGTTPIADAYANAKAGAIAIQTTGDDSPAPAIAADVVSTESVPSTTTSVAVTGSESTATAHAEGGDKPTAYTTAGSDIYALAVAGDKPSAIAYAGENSINDSRTTDGESWAISYVAGGQYSVAIATKDSAKAYSSTYGAGTSFTADDVWAAALTWASAYAEANTTMATAWAAAGAGASAGTQGGMSVAAAASRGGATIRIELVRHNVSSGGAAVECSVAVTDWAFLKTVQPGERYRYLSCTCPQGWQNAPGADRYSCVRAASGTKVDVKVKAKTLGAVVTKKKTSVAKAQTKATDKVVKNLAISSNQAIPIASLLETTVARN